MNHREDLIETIRSGSTALAPVATEETFRKTHGGENKQNGYDAVLFDVYGTLFISASGDISLAQDRYEKKPALSALAAKLKPGMAGEELTRLFLTEVSKEHERLRKRNVRYPEVRVEELWADIISADPETDRELCEKAALAYELAVNPVYPMPGLAQTLSAIAGKGIPMGIISNAQFFTPLLFDAFLGKTAEEAGICDDLSFYSFQYRKAKPDTFLYEQAVSALKKRGITPERVLYIGNDMLNDVMPAGACGFKTALFAGDGRSLRWRENNPAVDGISPDWVLSCLEDVISII